MQEKRLGQTALCVNRAWESLQGHGSVVTPQRTHSEDKLDFTGKLGEASVKSESPQTPQNTYRRNALGLPSVGNGLRGKGDSYHTV